MGPYSYSKLKTYLDCPQLFKFKYIDEIKMLEEPEYFIIGRLKHEILKESYLWCLKNKKGNVEEITRLYQGIFSRYNFDMEKEEQIKEEMDNYLSGKEFLLEPVPEIECKIAIDGREKSCDFWDEKCWLRGIIDVMRRDQHQAKIIDYKTGYSFYRDKFQMDFYAYLVRKLFPDLQRLQVEFDFINFDWQKTYEIDLYNIEDIGDRIKGMIDKVEGDWEYKPQVGSKCQSCGYWEYCEAFKGRGLKIQEDRSQVLETVIIMEKKMKELKEILKNHCEKYGEVICNDMRAHFKETEKIQWNVPELLKRCEEGGIDIIPALSVDNRKAKKYNLEFKEEVTQKEKGLRFTIEKGGKKDD